MENNTRVIQRYGLIFSLKKCMQLKRIRITRFMVTQALLYALTFISLSKRVYLFQSFCYESKQKNFINLCELKQIHLFLPLSYSLLLLLFHVKSVFVLQFCFLLKLLLFCSSKMLISIYSSDSFKLYLVQLVLS